jgi:signal transduction histidine kinase
MFGPNQVWRYLLAAVAGLAAWGGVLAVRLALPLTPARVVVLGLDLVLGGVALALLPWRRRHPLAVACATTALAGLSAAAFGAVTLAVASMATRHRRDWVAATAAVTLVVTLLSKLAYHAHFFPTGAGWSDTAGAVVLTLALFAATVATGYYLGARRDLVASLRRRLQAAEREQELAAQLARDGERTRIARDMHDALAHRITLVALHAGALAYRDDLTRTETAEAARTIQVNAQLALTELRGILGVLRSDVEHQPPTLADLPALLADVREAGSTVHLDASGVAEGDLPVLPEPLSRTSFRIVQESLTNASRHAAGRPVQVRLAGRPGTDLELEVRNPVAAPVGPVAAGLGLAGLTERAELAGGALEYRADADGFFVVRARFPWPPR